LLKKRGVKSCYFCRVWLLSQYQIFDFYTPILMKITLVIGLLFGLMSATAHAQFQGGGNQFGRPGGMQDIPQTPPKPKEFDPEVMATNETKWMTKKLDLNDEQSSDVDAINIKYAFKLFDMVTEFKKIIGNMKPDERPSQEKMDEIRRKREENQTKLTGYQDSRDKEMKTVLSGEQWDKYMKKRRPLYELIMGN
jgi:Domain of unknown function (DUF4890)